MSEFGENNEQELSPAERRRQTVENNRRLLAERRESGEIDPIDFEPSHIAHLQEYDQPLTKKEVGNKAVVLTQSELEQLGYLEIVRPSGELEFIDPEVTGYGPDDVLIIFPEDLGEKETQDE